MMSIARILGLKWLRAGVPPLLSCLLLLSCAPAAVIVSDRTPGHETSRAKASLVFRTETLHYEATFRHERDGNQYYVVITSPVQTTSHAQQPRWLEFHLDGAKFRLTRWTSLQQATQHSSKEFTCAGLMYQKCNRPRIAVERYTWVYPLPSQAVKRFSSLEHGHAVLAAQEVGITLMLEQHKDLIRSFFQSTLSGAAYD